MAITIADIERNKDLPAHPDLEQAVYILDHEAIARVVGADHHVRLGDMMFFSAKVFHLIKVLTERTKLLMIHSPSYGEDLAKVVHAEASH